MKVQRLGNDRDAIWLRLYVCLCVCVYISKIENEFITTWEKHESYENNEPYEKIEASNKANISTHPIPHRNEPTQKVSKPNRNI